MISIQIQTIRDHLIATAKEVDHWFDKDAALRAFPPSDGGWTIDQVLEHISLTSHFLLILIDKGVKKAKNKVAAQNLEEALENYTFHQEKLEQIGQHQSFEWIRPIHMEPKGNQPLDTVRATIQSQFQRCIQHLDDLPNGEGTLHRTRMTVNQLGKIDMYEYIYFLSKHAERHLQQMAKIESEYQAG